MANRAAAKKTWLSRFGQPSREAQCARCRRTCGVVLEPAYVVDYEGLVCIDCFEGGKA